MKRFANLPFVGPVIIFAAMVAAEGAAFALAQNPTSAWLWYLNLHVLPLFQQSHYVLDGLFGVPASGLFFIALPLLALGLIGSIMRRNLLLALSSNFSVFYALFLVFSWKLTHPPHLGPAVQASLKPIVMPAGPDLYMLAALLIGSVLSAWMSHILYLRTIRDRH